MKLSIIIPVYNERKYFLTLLNKVKKVNLGKIKKEIIIVEDCSTDGTREMLKKLKDKSVKIIFQEKNGGKGTAVRTGLKHVTGDIIIIQDADLEYDPNEYTKLIKPILEGRTKVVYGNRIHKGQRHRYYFFYLGNILISLFTTILYGKKINDVETCYKMFTKDVIKGMKLRGKTFDLDPEITAKILRKTKIIEVPINYKSRSIDEGKKISWKDGVMALWYLTKYRFVD